MMQLQDILFSQGFGTRRVCCGLVQQGLVRVAVEGGFEVCLDPSASFAEEGLVFQVQGETWSYQERAYLMVHKPAGFECSQKPSTYPSIYTLLPSPLRLRPQKAAEILSVQDSSIAVQILQKIDPKKASKIFNFMDKDISAKLQKQYLLMKK